MMPVVPPAYRGRFAPSPSGPLHFGSLIAAVGSYLQAKSQQGQWLVRMEDIDSPRMQAGAADGILRTLERYQLLWDGDVWVQSHRLERYQQVLDLLKQQQLTYACNCNRSRIQSLPHGYDGFCRDKQLTEGSLAWRLKAPATATIFTDQLAGDAKAQARFDLRTHLAGVLVAPTQGAGLHRHQFDRAHGLFGGGGRTAGGQGQQKQGPGGPARQRRQKVEFHS